MDSEARRSHLASGLRSLRRHDRAPSRWLWRIRRGRKLQRWNHGEAVHRDDPRWLIEMSRGPAGEHTEAQIERQLELARHNGQAVRVIVMRRDWS